MPRGKNEISGPPPVPLGIEATDSLRPQSAVWDGHWQSIDGAASWFGRLASFVRLTIISRAVRHYADRYFADSGVFVECGCGTAQSSSRLPAGKRRYVALDFSREALRAARGIDCFGGFLRGDIFHLPFADGSITGVWNLGVMEHFEANDGIEILCELRRALAPGGVAVLFWPPEFGFSRLVLGPIEALLSLVRKKPVQFFPDEVNRLRSRNHARQLLASAGLEAAAVEFTVRDLFIHIVVVARKPV